MNKENDKKNTDISERISEILVFCKENRNSFAIKLGYERAQTIYDILNGKSAPSYEFFKRFQLSEFSEMINLDWLLTGRGDMQKSPHEKPEKEPDQAPLLFIEKMEGYNQQIGALKKTVEDLTKENRQLKEKIKHLGNEEAAKAVPERSTVHS